MSDAETKSTRPIAITLLCLFMVFGGVVAVATFLTPVYEQFPVWYQYSVAVNTALGFVIVFGLWKMRRWAVMLYANNSWASGNDCARRVDGICTYLPPHRSCNYGRLLS